MASFLAGPAAQLVGAGMQAIGVGIPVGETCSKVIDGMRGCGLPVPPKTWFKTKQQQPEERTPQRNVYDKLESHLNGMIQVAKPALELKNIVRNGCKSADRATCRRGSHQSPKEKAIFYTPQNCSSGRCKLFDDRTPNLVRIPPEKKVAKRSCKNSGGDCKKKSRKPRDDSSDEDESCIYCSRSRSLIELPCGRLICSKCDKTGDHDLESNMSRPSRNVKNTEPLAVIDLTQDSPANTALRRSRIRSVDAVSPIIECGEINTVKVSSNPVGERLKVKKRRNKAAVVINLDETINLDNTPTNTNQTQPQAVLPEPPAKKELLTCPICFENLADGNTQAMTTPCGHIFCLACLSRIVKEKKKCSLCQKEIKKSHCIRLHI